MLSQLQTFMVVEEEEKKDLMDRMEVVELAQITTNINIAYHQQTKFAI
jgi:nitrate reductase NapAB chaperone NapD